MNVIDHRENFLKKLAKLTELDLPCNEYAITGSGPLAIRGIREANDVDVVVKPVLWNKLLKKHSPYDSKHMRIGNIEIWGDFINLTSRMEEVIDHAEVIDGFPFVSLQDTLSWKKFLNREKDQRDILSIEHLLRDFDS